jgi:signal peptidase I
MKDSLLVGDHLFAKKFVYGISTPHLPFIEMSLTPWTDDLHLIDGGEPKRGDIVIFRYPHNVKMHYVKRCVALPGDQLFVKDKDLYLRPHEGDAFINANYPKESILTIDGKLWVKNPYVKEHPGIHHDDRIIGDTPVLLANDGRMERIDTVEKMAMILQNQVQLPADVKFVHHNPIFQTDIITVPKRNYFMMGDNRDHSNDSRFWGPVPYANLEGTPWFIYFSMDDHFEIRWDRMGKTPTDLEQPEHLNLARKARILEDSKDNGLY